jgi:Endonuclease/Exonuclease/phosphatase family
MKNIKFLVLIFIFATINSMAQTKKYNLHTVAFYNFENLFDSKNDANKDDEWTPSGEQHWTEAKYKQKLENLAQVLSGIGTNDKQVVSPTLIGGSEIENRGVLEDLVKQSQLINSDYGIVHYDSPDKRGIDVALLYKKKYFTVTDSQTIPLIIHEEGNEKKERIYTRDVLLVTGLLEGEEISVLVNHWPSRSGGEKKTSAYREAAAQLDKKVMNSIYEKNPKAKIICMGDLNDGTTNKSIKVNLDAKHNKEEVKEFGIYNPFEKMEKEGHATLYHNDAGAIFDQIMVSQTLINKDFSSYQFWKAGIYNKPFMIEHHGKYRGYPKRNSDNEVGFSDHFPVYIYLIKEAQ